MLGLEVGKHTHEEDDEVVELEAVLTDCLPADIHKNTVHTFCWTCDVLHRVVYYRESSGQPTRRLDIFLASAAPLSGVVGYTTPRKAPGTGVAPPYASKVIQFLDCPDQLSTECTPLAARMQRSGVVCFTGITCKAGYRQSITCANSTAWLAIATSPLSWIVKKAHTPCSAVTRQALFCEREAAFLGE